MRCYNGCPDSEMQALHNHQEALLREVRRHEPEAVCTRFPMEETFQVHVWGRPLSGHHSSRSEALSAALARLTEGVS